MQKVLILENGYFFMSFRKRGGMNYGGSQPRGKKDRRKGPISMENLSITRMRGLLADRRRKVKASSLVGDPSDVSDIKKLQKEIARRLKFKE